MTGIETAMLISGILGGGAGAGSLFMPGGKKLPPDFWKEYYSPYRVQIATEPARREFTAREIAGGETWGGRGLETSEGAKKESMARESALADIEAKAGAQEVERASQYGLTDWIRDYEEKQAQKDRLSNLAGQLLSLPTMYYGMKGLGMGVGEPIGEAMKMGKAFGEGYGASTPDITSEFPDLQVPSDLQNKEELMALLRELGLLEGGSYV